MPGVFRRLTTNRFARSARRCANGLAAVAAVLALAACVPSAPSAPPSVVSPDPPAPPPSTPAPESGDTGVAASRVIFWTKCSSVLDLTDAELDQWRDRGVGGFVCEIPYLRGLGGELDFTADPSNPLTGTNYALQRRALDTRIVERAAARDIKLWLGVGLGNYYEGKTPLADWFDDAKWAGTVVPKMTDFAGAARMLGFAGLAFDEEMYPTSSGERATWEWHYSGNTHSEAHVRAAARARGAQLMRAILAGYPGVEIIDYWTYFPEGWEAYVQQQVNGIANANATKVQIDFWDGMTSVSGYGRIHFVNAIFYKTAQLPGATWDSALTYDDNRVFALLSRRLSNWVYASSRIELSPFAWIDAGPTSFDAARPPDQVAKQLAAFRRWGMGGAFANYAYAGLRSFDYTPYVPGLQAAATPGVVDTQAPTVTVTSVGRIPGGASLSGAAGDNMAIRAVRWTTASGASGAAPMVWTVTSGSYSTGYGWRMDWNATIPASPGERVTITVEDIKGLTTATTVTA
jgi:hypothetical protein